MRRQPARRWLDVKPGMLRWPRVGGGKSTGDIATWSMGSAFTGAGRNALNTPTLGGWPDYRDPRVGVGEGLMINIMKWQLKPLVTSACLTRPNHCKAAVCRPSSEWRFADLKPDGAQEAPAPWQTPNDGLRSAPRSPTPGFMQTFCVRLNA